MIIGVPAGNTVALVGTTSVCVPVPMVSAVVLGAR
jgi:hypothetical protein